MSVLWHTKQGCVSVFASLPEALISIVGVVDHVTTDRLNRSLPADQNNTIKAWGLDVGNLREACQIGSSEKKLIAWY